MYSTAQYLLSGVTSLNSGTISVLGMDKFTVNINATPFGANVPTGTINLQARLDPSDTFTTFYSNAFNNTTGIIHRFDGPIESLRATMSSFTTGTYTVVARYSSQRG